MKRFTGHFGQLPGRGDSGATPPDYSEPLEPPSRCEDCGELEGEKHLPGCSVYARELKEQEAEELAEEPDEIVWACYCGNDVPPVVEPLTFYCRDCGEVGRVRRIFNSTGEPVEGEEGEN